MIPVAGKYSDLGTMIEGKIGTSRATAHTISYPFSIRCTADRLNRGWCGEEIYESYHDAEQAAN